MKIKNRTLSRQIREYMTRQIHVYVDPRTGEVNCTGLAVDAAIGMDHPEWLDDDTHMVWELAVDMAGLWGVYNDALWVVSNDQ